MCLTPCRNFELPWLDDRSRCRIEVPKKHTPHRTCRKWCNSTGHWRPKSSHVADHLVKKQTNQQTRKTKKRQLLSWSVWHVSPLYHQRAACRAPSRPQHAKEELSCATAEEQNHRLKKISPSVCRGQCSESLHPTLLCCVTTCMVLPTVASISLCNVTSGVVSRVRHDTEKKGKNWPNLMQVEQLMQASVC